METVNKIIPIDIYNTDLLVVVGTTEDLENALKGHLGEEEGEEAYALMAEDISDISLGRSALLECGAVAMWMPDASDKATMAHEIFHVVTYITEKVGIRLSHDSDEAYAYLIGYITKKVNEAVNLSSDGAQSQ